MEKVIRLMSPDDGLQRDLEALIPADILASAKADEQRFMPALAKDPAKVHTLKQSFLDELDKVWRHVHRVLVPGGRLIVVVGDVCLSRRAFGRHVVFPLHASIQEGSGFSRFGR